MAVETPVGKLMAALIAAVRSVEGIAAATPTQASPSPSKPRNAPSSKAWALVLLGRSEAIVGEIAAGRRPWRIRFTVRIWAGGRDAALRAADLAYRAALAAAEVRTDQAEIIQVALAGSDQDPEISAAYVDVQAEARVRCP